MINSSLINSAAFFTGSYVLSQTSWVQKPLNLSGLTLSTSVNALMLALPNKTAQVAGFFFGIALLSVFSKALSLRTTIVIHPIATIQFATLHAIIKASIDYFQPDQKITPKATETLTSKHPPPEKPVVKSPPIIEPVKPLPPKPKEEEPSAWSTTTKVLLFSAVILGAILIPTALTCMKATQVKPDPPIEDDVPCLPEEAPNSSSAYPTLIEQPATFNMTKQVKASLPTFSLPKTNPLISRVHQKFLDQQAAMLRAKESQEALYTPPNDICPWLDRPTIEPSSFTFSFPKPNTLLSRIHQTYIEKQAVNETQVTLEMPVEKACETIIDLDQYRVFRLDPDETTCYPMTVSAGLLNRVAFETGTFRGTPYSSLSFENRGDFNRFAQDNLIPIAENALLPPSKNILPDEAPQKVTRNTLHTSWGAIAAAAFAFFFSIESSQSYTSKRKAREKEQHSQIVTPYIDFEKLLKGKPQLTLISGNNLLYISRGKKPPLIVPSKLPKGSVKFWTQKGINVSTIRFPSEELLQRFIKTNSLLDHATQPLASTESKEKSIPSLRLTEKVNPRLWAATSNALPFALQKLKKVTIAKTTLDSFDHYDYASDPKSNCDALRWEAEQMFDRKIDDGDWAGMTEEIAWHAVNAAFKKGNLSSWEDVDAIHLYVDHTNVGNLTATALVVRTFDHSGRSFTSANSWLLQSKRSSPPAPVCMENPNATPLEMENIPNEFFQLSKFSYSTIDNEYKQFSDLKALPKELNRIFGDEPIDNWTRYTQMIANRAKEIVEKKEKQWADVEEFSFHIERTQKSFVCFLTIKLQEIEQPIIDSMIGKA